MTLSMVNLNHCKTCATRFAIYKIISIYLEAYRLMCLSWQPKNDCRLI